MSWVHSLRKWQEIVWTVCWVHPCCLCPTDESEGSTVHQMPSDKPTWNQSLCSQCWPKTAVMSLLGKMDPPEWQLCIRIWARLNFGVFQEMKGQGFFIGKGTDHAHGQVLKVLLSYCLMKPLILWEVEIPDWESDRFYWPTHQTSSYPNCIPVAVLQGTTWSPFFPKLPGSEKVLSFPRMWR